MSSKIRNVATSFKSLCGGMSAISPISVHHFTVGAMNLGPPIDDDTEEKLTWHLSRGMHHKEQ